MAQRLRVPYFNAGLLYRALTLWCISEDIPLDNTDDATVTAARKFPVLVSLDHGTTTVSLAGRDVSDQLKIADVNRAVPMVARHRGFRGIMNAHQRAIVRHAVSTFGGVVIDGRDATTVVVPDADVKILLVTNQEARAQRVRTAEGAAAAAARDAADAAISDFLRPRSEIAVFDTSDLGMDDLVSQVLTYVFEQHPR